SLLRRIDPEARIGPVCAIQVVYPQSSRSEDVLAAANAEELMEFYLLDMSVYGTYPPYVASYLKSHGLYPHTEPEDAAALQASKPDFIGINYYFSLCVKAKTGPINYDQPPFWVSDAFDVCDNPYLEKTEWMDKGIDPEGLHIGMRKVYNRYRLPMIVTENGMAYSEAPGPDGRIHDVYRIDYLRRHIEQLEIMLEEGLPVFGYCPWSFVDVVSSHQGFAKRYGLVYVNRTDTDVMDCARIRKDSFNWYQQVIRHNGLWEE
ncbi:MAG TPA: family 1 glycosylhydrolase, partial [Candidatus Gemmiger excrementavium]|nr:family 1 glycosylhydrolase [Candidatus Gemmiger excrementavium]